VRPGHRSSQEILVGVKVFLQEAILGVKPAIRVIVVLFGLVFVAGGVALLLHHYDYGDFQLTQAAIVGSCIAGVVLALAMHLRR
jgi:hypothetical protein